MPNAPERVRRQITLNSSCGMEGLIEPVEAGQLGRTRSIPELQRQRAVFFSPSNPSASRIPNLLLFEFALDNRPDTGLGRERPDVDGAHSPAVRLHVREVGVQPGCHLFAHR